MDPAARQSFCQPLTKTLGEYRILQCVTLGEVGASVLGSEEMVRRISYTTMGGAHITRLTANCKSWERKCIAEDSRTSKCTLTDVTDLCDRSLVWQGLDSMTFSLVSAQLPVDWCVQSPDKGKSHFNNNIYDCSSCTAETRCEIHL